MPKLEAASKLYSGAGVLLNLGDCYEHLGRTASAWNEFGEAASTAERAGRPTDMAEALHRQRLVEPRLCRLAVSVSSRAPGLVVTRTDSTSIAVRGASPFPSIPAAIPSLRRQRATTHGASLSR